MSLQALILVGGLGTRLRDLVKDRPKPMALINGRPFLEYQIGFLKSGGFTNIILSMGYMVFPEKFSLKNFFHQVMKRNRIFSFVSDSYFVDIGTIDDYKKFNEHITNKKIDM